MEDDDEFGDLYSDVLLPVSAPPPPSLSRPAPNPPSDPLFDDDDDDDRILYGAPLSSTPVSQRHPASVPALDDDADGDWLLGGPTAAVERPGNWDDNADVDAALNSLVPASDLRGSPRVLDEEVDGEARASDVDPFLDQKIEIGDPYEELVIPGLSAGPLAPGPSDERVSGRDDWDSDSEDDLQIVLNESNPVLPFGGDRIDGMGEEDDEDGDEDLVIVANDQQPNHRQAMEEQEWGEESLQPVADGERKEMLEAGKVNSAAGNAAAARIGYSNHGFNPQHHSMYKYIRPGAGPVPGPPVVGALGGPGQIRPPPSLGPTAGRGRGDWRPPGGRGMIPNAHKNFNSGYGMPWANNTSGRGFGSGLDFTLPSHKTAFDIDIETFDEKPWRYPGVDISEFFNFGLDEDNWKAYCKQLEQLRLEATMQSKIRVYEGGRSDQDYDPDLPPELAAAAGHHDSSDIVNHAKVDNGQIDLNGLGRGAGGLRAPLPIGRAIMVETGSGERLPSIDTRPPRFRDSDAIIEVPLQDSLDDPALCNGEPPEKELQEDLKAVHDIEEDDGDTESESLNRFPHSFNGRRRESTARKGPSGAEDGILPFPPGSPVQYHPNFKMQSPVNTGGPSGTHRGGRLPRGSSRGRQHSMSREHSVDANSGRNAHSDRHDSHLIEQPRETTEVNQTSETSSARGVSTTKGPSLEQRDSELDERLALGDSIEVGEEDGETPGDDSLDHYSKKQKLSSRVEQPSVQENGEEEAKSGSSKDHQKRREADEEVIQGVQRSRRTSDSKRRHEEEERNVRQKDDYARDGRHEADRIRAVSKGRETLHHSYPHKDWDSSSAHHVRGRSEAFERQKEMDGRQRREDDIHSRRVKEEDARRERNEELGSKNRSRVKVGDRNGKDDDVNMKKRAGDDGDLRGRRRESVPRQRERDDLLLKRRENLDEPPTKRKKVEEYSRREKTDREDPIRRKRERDDGADHRRREDDTRTRDKADDRHLVKPRDDSWRPREREDRQRPKQSQKDTREREEGRTTIRNGRAAEDKPLAGGGKSKDVSKAMGSDKDNQNKDRSRQNDQFKRPDRACEGKDSQHKGREKRMGNEQRSPRHERSTGRHSDRPLNASESQQAHGEKYRENTRKNKDLEASEQNILGKRKHLEENTHQNDKASLKGSSEQGGHSHNDEQPGVSHGKFGEDDPLSDDENQKGRSKLERWTSHTERDYSVPSSSRAVVEDPTNSEMIQADESTNTEGNNANDPESKGVDAGQFADKAGEDGGDPHRDTVAKLKRRSERFKLAMPGEKDSSQNKKAENEVQLTPNDAAAAADLEIKTERPARTRKWTGS